jgi:hypothetical protein
MERKYYILKSDLGEMVTDIDAPRIVVLMQKYLNCIDIQLVLSTTKRTQLYDKAFSPMEHESVNAAWQLAIMEY